MSIFQSILSQMKGAVKSPELNEMERKSMMKAIAEMERQRRNRVNHEVKSVFDVSYEASLSFENEEGNLVANCLEQLKEASKNRGRKTLGGESVLEVMKVREGIEGRSLKDADIRRLIIKYWINETDNAIFKLHQVTRCAQQRNTLVKVSAYLDERKIHFENNKGKEWA